MVKGGGVILLPCLCILIMPISVCQETCCLEILMMDLGQVSFHTPPPPPQPYQTYSKQTCQVSQIFCYESIESGTNLLMSCNSPKVAQNQDLREAPCEVLGNWCLKYLLQQPK